MERKDLQVAYEKAPLVCRQKKSYICKIDIATHYILQYDPISLHIGFWILGSKAMDVQRGVYSNIISGTVCQKTIPLTSSMSSRPFANSSPCLAGQKPFSLDTNCFITAQVNEASVSARAPP